MQQLQQTCYESIWSRSICHPSYNVPIPAMRFFFIYLVQSHFVVFHPFPSHILCLWLSLDFSQTDKLISFIHTWSFSLLSPCLDFFPPWHPSSFQLAGHRALLYENSLDLKGRSLMALGEGWGRWGGRPAHGSEFLSYLVCHSESQASAVGIPSSTNCLLASYCIYWLKTWT